MHSPRKAQAARFATRPRSDGAPSWPGSLSSKHRPVLPMVPAAVCAAAACRGAARGWSLCAWSSSIRGVRGVLPLPRRQRREKSLQILPWLVVRRGSIVACEGTLSLGARLWYRTYRIGSKTPGRSGGLLGVRFCKLAVFLIHRKTSRKEFRAEFREQNTL